MFDLRYHVASLTAVFLALVIGILVGVGISGRGFVDDAERNRLNGEIARLQASLDAARERNEELERRQAAAEEFVESAYPVLAAGRLEDVDVAILVVGSYDGTVDDVQRAVDDADGEIARIRAVAVPLPYDDVEGALRSRPELGGYVGDEELLNVGRDLGRELVDGGDTPLWDALTADIVAQREGGSFTAADAVVVVRQAEPQQRETARFLAGLYRGLASAGVPAVGVERTNSEQSAVPPFARAGLSTVDGVDTAVGKLALILLLSGSERGHFGTRETADDGILPPIEPLPPVDEGE